MSRDKLRIGVIGTGVLGAHHARVFSGLESAELVAVFDLDADKAQRVAAPLGASVSPSLEAFVASVDAAVVVERAETRAELTDALVRLPVIYRSAVVLHDCEGLSSTEIADIHQIGLPAAKQRLRRGRMMLVSALSAGVERRESLKGQQMRCWDARAQVSDYLDDELVAARRRALERHLESCPTCPPLYAGLVGAKSAVGSLRDPDSVVPTSLAERIDALLGT